ncbi:hypothetical protein [Nostoc sp.]|uniref:hypothetical protein n=1 Tax=Nostoc sp. TaxID=1180 RepID=UPI002FFD34F3
MKRYSKQAEGWLLSDFSSLEHLFLWIELRSHYRWRKFIAALFLSKYFRYISL